MQASMCDGSGEYGRGGNPLLNEYSRNTYCVSGALTVCQVLHSGWGGGGNAAGNQADKGPALRGLPC